MSKLESMQGAARMAVLAAALALYAPGALAHHNSQAEFGAFGSDTIAVEGTIVDVHWSNPHISIDIRTTGGDLPAVRGQPAGRSNSGDPHRRRSGGGSE